MITRRGFLEAMGVGACAGPRLVRGGQGLPSAMTTGYGVPEASKHIYVGTDRQYFSDDFLLTTGSAMEEDIPHNVRFNVGRAYKDEAPVMLPGVDAPWEKEGMYWVTVIYDGGRYRCWYNTTSYQSARPEYPQQTSIGHNQVVWMMVSYAESDDGINWRKPVLNMVGFNGSKANNICFPGDLTRWVEGCGVFVDPSAEDEERYKMVFRDSGGLKGAYSSDGLSWKLKDGVFAIRGLDTQNTATYDPALRRYVAYIRSNSVNYGGLGVGKHSVQPVMRGRSVARIEVPEFGNYPYWSLPEVVLAPDIEDGLCVDFYTCPYSHYGNVHYMLFSPYNHWGGNLNIQVAVSRDNRQWVRPTRATLVENGGEPGSYDQYRIYAGPGILPAGKDHIAIYTRSGQGPHPHSVAKGWKPGVWKTWKGLPEGCMGRVRFGRDRIVGIEAGSEEGNFGTRELIFEGRSLVVNAEPTGPDAELRVQIVTGVRTQFHHEAKNPAPITGRTFEECKPITTDELDGVVTWENGSDLGRWSGKPVRLHFHLRSMRLYAFQFVS
jgi:hypothetical protein